jgi:Tol biopolymer transport system component
MIGGSSRPLERTHGCWWPAWSPDGSRIACVGEGSIVTIASGESVALNLNPSGYGSWSEASPVWALDGHSITALGESAQDLLTAYRVAEDGTILSSIDLPFTSAWLPERQLSPDGSRLLARPCPVPPCTEAEFQVVPIDGSSPISLGSGHDALWSGDGSMVAITNLEGIFIADAKDGTTQIVVRTTAVHDVSWSPDQRQLLYSLENGELWTVAATGGEATLIDAGPVSTVSGGAAWQPIWP